MTSSVFANKLGVLNNDRLFGYNSNEVIKMVQRRYELSDEQWDKIKTYFERKKGRPYKNLRNTLNGMVWILRIGAS